MERLVKVGVMPGRLTEVAVNVGSTVGQAIELAQLGVSTSGYEIKMDGITVNTSTPITAATNLILLTQMVKGN